MMKWDGMATWYWKSGAKGAEQWDAYDEATCRRAESALKAGAQRFPAGDLAIIIVVPSPLCSATVA